MGNKCCAAEEVKDGQKDICDPQPAIQNDDSALGGAKAQQPQPGQQQHEDGEERKFATNVVREWTVTLKKTGKMKLGVDVDLGDSQHLYVDKVNPGLVEEWNKANPDKAVKEQHRIASVNGTKGNASKMTEVCKNDPVLEMLIQQVE